MTRKNHHYHGPTPFILWEDVRNGALDAFLSAASFSLALGFHPIVPIVAFLDGMLGRHLSRLRWTIASRGGDTVIANGAALLTHIAIGVVKFGVFINPVAGYGISLGSILRVSFSNSLAKGSFRLVFDKAFGEQGERRRALGVAYASLLTFGQGLLCGMVYKGSSTATILHFSFALSGVGLLLVPSARRFYVAWSSFRDQLDSEPIVPTSQPFRRSSDTRIPQLVA